MGVDSLLFLFIIPHTGIQNRPNCVFDLIFRNEPENGKDLLRINGAYIVKGKKSLVEDTMQDIIRLFVAAPLPPELRTYLVQAQTTFEDPAIRAVPEANLHLTFYFIGNVDAAQVPVIQQKLAEIAAQSSPFTLQLQQLEPGPSPKSTRLIWARFQQHNTFNKISRSVTSALSTSVPKKEDIIPHVTLCRFKKDTHQPVNQPIITPEKSIEFPVNYLALWQSQLGSPHPIYTVKEEFPLGKPVT